MSKRECSVNLVDAIIPRYICARCVLKFYRTMCSTGSGCILMQVTCWPFVAPNKTESGWLYWSLGESMLRSEISRLCQYLTLMPYLSHKASSCSSYPDIWIELHDHFFFRACFLRSSPSYHGPVAWLFHWKQRENNGKTEFFKHQLTTLWRSVAHFCGHLCHRKSLGSG